MGVSKVKKLSKEAIKAQVGSYVEVDPEKDLKVAREKGEKARKAAEKAAS